MDLYTNLVGFFQNGGTFMYPIGLVLALGLAITIERALFLFSADGANRRDLKNLLPLVQQGRLRELQTQLAKPKSAVANLYAAALLRLPTTRRRQDLEYAMEESMIELVPPLEKRTPFLATFANVATLLGLLGTIIGLIAAFTAVADADPTEKARLLSSSISIAMNTTAFGLMAAIPLLLVHAWLQGKSQSAVERLDSAMVKFLNHLEANHKWAPDGKPVVAGSDTTVPNPDTALPKNRAAPARSRAA